MHVSGWVRLVMLSAAGGLTFGATWTEVDSGLPRTPVGVNILVVDPSSPSTIYALTLAPVGYGHGSLFKSTDGGGMWNVVQGVASVSVLAIDPSNSSTLYAVASDTVLKCTDGGQSWIGLGIGMGVSAIAIDPQNTTTLYAMSESAILKSSDGGASWSSKTTGLPGLLLDGHLAIDPQTPSTIFAVVGIGLYKSADGGESWRGPMVQGGACHCPVAIDPANPSTVYAVLLSPGNFRMGGDPSALFKSTDGGENWTVIDVGIPANQVISLAVDAASTVYASYVAYKIYGDASYGVVKSINGGASWNAVNNGLPSGTARIFSLAANPSSVFAGYSDWPTGRGGVFTTLDGGANWNDASEGLAILDIHALAIDAVHPATVYVAVGDGVSRSIDGGADWSTVHFQSPFFGTAYVPSLSVDPGNPNVLYASLLATGGCSYTDPFLRKSTDGGATWNDLPVTYCAVGGTISLAMDPTDPNTLYAAPQDAIDCGAYMYGTSDGGASWNQTFLWGTTMTLLALVPGNPPTLYAEFGGGLHMTNDNGNTWSSTTLTDIAVNVLAVDPRNASVVYAGGHTTDGKPAVFETTDGGATWSPLNTALAGIVSADASITALVVDPKRSVLYLGTSGSGAFKSTDGGKTWSAFNDGLPSLDIRALAVGSDGSGQYTWALRGVSSQPWTGKR